jgi:hypothetical protein
MHAVQRGEQAVQAGVRDRVLQRQSDGVGAPFFGARILTEQPKDDFDLGIHVKPRRGMIDKKYLGDLLTEYLLYLRDKDLAERGQPNFDFKVS